MIADAVLNDRKALKAKLDSGLEPNTMFRGAIGNLDVLWNLVLKDSSPGSRQAWITRSQSAIRGEIRDAETLANRYGEGTILMWAVVSESLSVVKLLLDYGADPEAETENGLSARKIASRLPVKPAIKQLILKT